MDRESKKSSAIAHYRILFWRRKFVLLIFACLGGALFSLASLRLPNIYFSRALVLVEKTSLPADISEFGLPYEPDTYLKSIVEQVKSSSRLRTLIDELDLFPDELDSGVHVDTLVDKMRGLIKIQRSPGGTFSISYEGKNPRKVQQVAQRLTNGFIDENVRYRLKRLEQNVALLKEESRKLQSKVSTKESAVEQFKRSKLEHLPGEETRVKEDLVLTKAQLAATTTNLERSRAKLVTIQQRIQALLAREDGRRTSTASATETQELREALREAERKLLETETRFTRHHPDYQKQRQVVAKLRNELVRASKRTKPRQPRRQLSPNLIAALEEEKELAAKIEKLDQIQGRLQTSISESTAQLEGFPEVELKLSALTRGLKSLKEQAKTYKKRAEEASTALELERLARGKHFRILDPPKVATNPIRPNRRKWAVIGSLLGLLLGILLVYQIDVVVRPFDTEKELADYSGLPVLTAIPRAGPPQTESRTFWKQFLNLLRYIIDLIFSRDAARSHPWGGATPVIREESESELEEEEIPAYQIKGYRYLTGEAILRESGITLETGQNSTGEEGSPEEGSNKSTGASPWPSSPGSGPRSGSAHLPASVTEEKSSKLPAEKGQIGIPREEQENISDDEIAFASAETQEVNPKGQKTGGNAGNGEAVIEKGDVTRKKGSASEGAGSVSKETSSILDGGWGEPSRYVLDPEPCLGPPRDQPHESTKELCRRAPWRSNPT